MNAPAEWRAQPPGPSSKAIGYAWVREARSAVLEAPSILIRGEANYLLNPAHPDFKKIAISKGEQFAFDPRLIG